MSPAPRRIPRWLLPVMLVVASACVLVVWVSLALYLERPCTWMAVLGAIDAALILRFAGMPAGWARATWAVLATALMIALANWGIAATQMGMSMGLNPLDSAMKLGMGHAWTLLGLANHTIDLVWMGVALVVAAIAAR